MCARVRACVSLGCHGNWVSHSAAVGLVTLALTACFPFIPLSLLFPPSVSLSLRFHTHKQRGTYAHDKYSGQHSSAIPPHRKSQRDFQSRRRALLNRQNEAFFQTNTKKAGIIAETSSEMNESGPYVGLKAGIISIKKVLPVGNPLVCVKTHYLAHGLHSGVLD